MGGVDVYKRRKRIISNDPPNHCQTTFTQAGSQLRPRKGGPPTRVPVITPSPSSRFGTEETGSTSYQRTWQQIPPPFPPRSDDDLGSGPRPPPMSSHRCEGAA